MLIYLAAAAALLGLPLFGLMPPVRRGRAMSKIFCVTMPDPATTYPGRWQAVLAEELTEWWAAWAIAFVIALPGALVLSALPFGAALIPLLLIAAWSLRLTPWLYREIEYIGQGAEWLEGQRIAPGHYTDFRAYARAMRNNYRQMRHLSVDEAEAALRSRLPVARFVLALMRRRIERAAQ